MKSRIFCFLVLAIGFSTGADADPVLKMKFRKQLQTNWCWAATAESTIEYMRKRAGNDTGVSQCKIVNNYNNPGLDCCVDANASKTKCNQPGSIYKPLDNHGYIKAQLNGQLTDERFDLLIDELKAGRPIPAAIKWEGKDVGHAVIVYGLGFPAFAGGQAIYIDDPTTGKQAAIQDKNSLNNYGAAFNGSWRAMYHLQDKK